MLPLVMVDVKEFHPVPTYILSCMHACMYICHMYVCMHACVYGYGYFKNTKNLFIHIAHYPVRRFLRDITTF